MWQQLLPAGNGAVLHIFCAVDCAAGTGGMTDPSHMIGMPYDTSSCSSKELSGGPALLQQNAEPALPRLQCYASALLLYRTLNAAFCQPE